MHNKEDGQMKKVLFINPDCEMKTSTTPLVGLTELGAYLKKYGGYETYYIDLSLTKYSIADIFSYDVDIYGISVIALHIQYAIEISKLIKEKNPNATVFWGGYYPTSNPSDCLKCEYVDYLILGEGEIPTLELLNYVNACCNKKLEDIPGIAYRGISNECITNPVIYLNSLDEIPFPEINMLDLDEYTKIDSFTGSRTMSIMDSRGCPMKCTFCSPSKHWGYTYRSKSAERFINEVKFYRERYSFEHLRIMGCIFTLERERAIKIAQGLAELGLTWDVQTRPELVDEEMISIFANSGLTEIFFGIESGSKRILKNMNKMIDLDKTLESVRICKKYGIKVEASFQLGMIGENYESYLETVEYATKLMQIGLDTIKLFTSTPFPGTEYTKKVTELGYIHDLSPLACDASSPICDTGFLSNSDIEILAQDFINRVPIAKWGRHSKKGSAEKSNKKRVYE